MVGLTAQWSVTGIHCWMWNCWNFSTEPQNLRFWSNKAPRDKPIWHANICGSICAYTQNMLNTWNLLSVQHFKSKKGKKQFLNLFTLDNTDELMPFGISTTYAFFFFLIVKCSICLFICSGIFAHFNCFASHSYFSLLASVTLYWWFFQQGKVKAFVLFCFLLGISQLT